MLQVTKLLRLLEAQRYGQVIDEVLRNGRPLPVALRSRLAGEAEARFAALGFGLQRVVELSYAPSAEAERLAAAAVDASSELSGGGGGAAVMVRPSPAAMAILIAGLVDVLGLADSTGCDLSPGLPGRIRAVIRTACYELAEAQAGLAVRDARSGGLVGDAVDSSVVLWQLGPRHEALLGLEVPSFRRLEEAAARLELWRDPVCGPVLALAQASPVHRTRPARRAAA
jgi:hypothetical protein